MSQQYISVYNDEFYNDEFSMKSEFSVYLKTVLRHQNAHNENQLSKSFFETTSSYFFLTLYDTRSAND